MLLDVWITLEHWEHLLAVNVLLVNHGCDPRFARHRFDSCGDRPGNEVL